MEEIDVSLYKLASAQVGTFPQLVRKVAALGKPTIFSTGIATYDEVTKTVKIFEEENNPNYIILHCNSMYPTPYDKVNLGRIQVYQEMFGKIVGYSDHSDGIYTAIAAVAKGAKVIEKHFAIDRSLPVPDAPFSLEPDEFKQMVEGIRVAELAAGADPRGELESDEQAFKEKILYRLYLNKTKSKGEVLQEADLDYYRSPEGIDCRRSAEVIGKKLKQDVEAGERLEFEMIK